MDQRTLAALQASIEHWERNAAATDPRKVRMGALSCALCAEFYGTPAECKGCPIYAATGKDGCRDTPYGKAYYYTKVVNNCPLESKAEAMASFRAAARAEVRFLSSLLPQD